MKKLTGSPYFIGVFLLAIACGCAQQQYPESYTVNGTIQGVPSGKVKLVKSNPADRTSTTMTAPTLQTPALP
jgi:hypothetical protein